jgi:hypothetical protein
MSGHRLRFRQVHLDFHTSPHITDIGKEFNKAEWQEALRIGHVNSITCFSKCHHGWSYHPTKVGRMHPHLDFDLLRAQIEASKEIGVNVPVYISAGADNLMAYEHPEWREVSIEGKYQGWSPQTNQPGFKKMCFNTPYLDFLCDQISEVVQMFPECDGIFLDIVFQGECCCKWCLDYMLRNGLDPDKPEHRLICAEASLEKYYQKATAAARCCNPNMPVFHNSGHVPKGKRDVLKYFSHLELESLPTGGWGYDHFPLSAKYAQHTGLDVLGMTGRFHTTWGEFGGYKHPNALRYECAAMLAFGAKCSIGDQLHPSGKMDMSTYRIIGMAYEEVEKKEPWCDNVTSVSDIAVLSSEAESGDRNPDTGAGRILLEEHFLFDLVDRQVDFSPYKMLILPDVIQIDPALKEKIEAFLAKGGKLFLTGKSGLWKNDFGFAFDLGVEFHGESPFQPDYVETDVLAPSFVASPLVMYLRSQQIKPIECEVLAGIRKPYFNRTWKHFCSHQHAPAADLSEYVAAVRKGSIVYLSHPVFSIYYALGAVAHREYVANALRYLLGEDITLKTNLPSMARVTLNEQAAERRYVLHLLYANRVARGASMRLSEEGFVRDSSQIEVVEELLPLRNVEIELLLPKSVKSVTLEPQGKPLPFEIRGTRLLLKIEEFTCHQMVVLNY